MTHSMKGNNFHKVENDYGTGDLNMCLYVHLRFILVFERCQRKLQDVGINYRTFILNVSYQ